MKNLIVVLLSALAIGCANEHEAQLQAERDRKYQQHLRELAPLFGVLCAAA